MIVLYVFDHFVLDNTLALELRFLRQDPMAGSPRQRARSAANGTTVRILMRTTFFRYFVESLLGLALCCSFASGQTVTGSITGQVTDPSGALVSGATVIAENTATAVK